VTDGIIFFDHTSNFDTWNPNGILLRKDFEVCNGFHGLKMVISCFLGSI
jgi:hypothetical protein